MIAIKKWLFTIGILFLLAGCKDKVSKKEVNLASPAQKMVVDTLKKKPDTVKTRSFEGIADTTFVRLTDYSDDFAYDLRYATENNFLKTKVYECAECYTRAKTAKALIEANKAFMEQGVRIKFFDCYRPNSVQYLMWEIVPNPQYVANPVKGSIHNKGGAVDITLVSLDGEELDMGTDFDFFGKRAYHDNYDLPQHVLRNRAMLKKTMEEHGFWAIRTEWWHYNLAIASNDPVANFKWDCGD